MIPGTIQSLQSDNDPFDANLTKSQHRKGPLKSWLKFWEIDHFFKCPVVAMCLTLSEQKQLLKKSGIPAKNKSPFEIHETLVASSECESRLSRRVDSLLNRKFRKKTALLLELENEAFKRHFQAAFEVGDCMGVTWAAAVNPDLSPELKREIFGDTISHPREAGLLSPIRKTGAGAMAIVQIAHVPEKRKRPNKRLVFGMAKAGKGTIRIEIAETTLNRLLRAGQVCAADLRCLDCKSKQCLWRLCLRSCAENLKTGMDGITPRKGSERACGRYSGIEDGRGYSEK